MVDANDNLVKAALTYWVPGTFEGCCVRNNTQHLKELLVLTSGINQTLSHVFVVIPLGNGHPSSNKDFPRKCFLIEALIFIKDTIDHSVGSRARM